MDYEWQTWVLLVHGNLLDKMFRVLVFASNISDIVLFM